MGLFNFIKSKNEDTLENIIVIDYYNQEEKHDWLQIVKEVLLENRKPVLFFTAVWAPPCKQFFNSLSDPLMQKTLSGVTIINIDGDIDLEKENISQKFDVRAFPTFVRTDENGILLDKITGNAWKENIAVNMAPVMATFMQ